MNHEETIATYWEFRYKDSLKTERFLRVIDSLGYVPNERITAGLTSNVLVIHSCKYKYLSVDIDAIYLHSIRCGTLSPHHYAWYKGFYDERHDEAHTYHYTVNRKKLENLSEEEKLNINQQRRRIGLKPCPAVVWNSKIY